MIVINLRGTLSVSTALSGSLTSNNVSIGGRLDPISTITVIDETWPEYIGPYTVIPDVIAQSLDTDQHRMVDDVTVEAIPYDEVSNQYGTTVIIAS